MGCRARDPRRHRTTRSGTSRSHHEAEPFYICPHCGQAVDKRELGQVGPPRTPGRSRAVAVGRAIADAWIARSRVEQRAREDGADEKRDEGDGGICWFRN